MRQEFRSALERGLPYPILTVLEYLSQDDAGFNWSRQYRSAGYYSSIMLWISMCVCVLMFCLHCAAPKYGIYTMQVLGCLLLLTNLTYSTLVPKGEQKLVIPFEGQLLTFEYGWTFWLVMIGGCLSLVVGTLIVLIDRLFPNYIFTTVLDVDFDMRHQYYNDRKVLIGRTGLSMNNKRSALNNDRVNSQLDLEQTAMVAASSPPFSHNRNYRKMSPVPAVSSQNDGESSTDNEEERPAEIGTSEKNKDLTFHHTANQQSALQDRKSRKKNRIVGSKYINITTSTNGDCTTDLEHRVPFSQ